MNGTAKQYCPSCWHCNAVLPVLLALPSSIAYLFKADHMMALSRCEDSIARIVALPSCAVWPRMWHWYFQYCLLRIRAAAPLRNCQRQARKHDETHVITTHLGDSSRTLLCWHCIAVLPVFLALRSSIARLVGTAKQYCLSFWHCIAVLPVFSKLRLCFEKPCNT